MGVLYIEVDVSEGVLCILVLLLSRLCKTNAEEP